jgi:hypothetical protein
MGLPSRSAVRFVDIEIAGLELRSTAFLGDARVHISPSGSAFPLVAEVDRVDAELPRIAVHDATLIPGLLETTEAVTAVAVDFYRHPDNYEPAAGASPVAVRRERVMAGQQTETTEPPTGSAPAVETAPAGTVLIEFRLPGKHFLVIREEGDAVRIDRQHPQPDRGRNVAGATGLDSSEEPEWRMPDNWTTAERHHVRVTVKNAWRRYLAAQKAAHEAAQESAERKAAEQGAAAA